MNGELNHSQTKETFHTSTAASLCKGLLAGLKAGSVKSTAHDAIIFNLTKKVLDLLGMKDVINHTDGTLN